MEYTIPLAIAPPGVGRRQAEAELFKALAHPIRLQILEAIAQEEACVCHLTALLGQRQPYISQQLTVLRDAGLVLDRKEGQLVYYRPADARILRLVELARETLGAPVAHITAGTALANCPCPKCMAERT